jgi:hypothetical protein
MCCQPKKIIREVLSNSEQGICKSRVAMVNHGDITGIPGRQRKAIVFKGKIHRTDKAF